jgi:hypothetical protein
MCTRHNGDISETALASLGRIPTMRRADDSSRDIVSQAPAPKSKHMKKVSRGKQCFGSVPALIHFQLVAWIRIRIPKGDPDPGGIKRAKMKKKRS